VLLTPHGVKRARHRKLPAHRRLALALHLPRLL